MAENVTIMTMKLPKLIATSVVRGSMQGESHGGIYTIDFDNQEGQQHVDWNTSKIDFEGRGADRGLRGITFDGNDIYIAASDEIFCYDQEFNLQSSYKNRYLKHAHEICRMERRIFISSTGFDSLLSFNLDTKKFDWGFHLRQEYEQWSGGTYDPLRNTGPRPVNDFHINMVHVSKDGIFLSGLKTNGLLYLTPQNTIQKVCDLPSGTHNPQLWNDGVLFNDTASDCLRFVPRDGEEQAYKIITYKESDIEFAGIDDSNIARQGFARGLCTINDRFVAVGSSPSTISLYDLQSQQLIGSVNLSMDIRNAIHGLEIWPY
ncbi:MAG: hypothetical protein CMQ54_02985 [Gammaproteobacteria bacterium]|nr:hypothetical protein [Gammaproteobacteria bacterium]|tara:strand:+ start:3357 stop:4310 length:954 start_codon:yes stop_codon:yes gene_type:complete